MKIRYDGLNYSKGVSDLFFFGLGFFSTSQILAIVKGSTIIAFYSICLFAVICILLFSHQKCNIGIELSLRKRFIGWMSLSFVSGLVGLVYFSSDEIFTERILGYFPKILMYFLLFYLLSKDAKGKEHTTLIVQGLKYGVLLNVAWSIFDAVTFYSTGYSITNTLFTSYIAAVDQRYGQLSLILGPFIRTGGLNADPANIGMFATMVAAYGMLKKKYGLLLLALASALASVSFIAFIGIILVFLYHFLFEARAGKIGFKQLFPIALIVLILIFALNSDNESVVGALDGVSQRMSAKEDAGLEDDRTMYWVNFIPAMFSSPLYWVIGTGYMTASYPYLINHLIDHEYGAYDPENTYFSNFFDFGLVGFIFFVSFYIGSWKLLKKRIQYAPTEYNIVLLAGMEGILIAFAGYHFTLYSVVMLFSICTIIHTDKELS